MELRTLASRIGLYTVYDRNGPLCVAFWNGLHWFDHRQVERLKDDVVACIGPLPMLNS
jgi:hypothetical protein